MLRVLSLFSGIGAFEVALDEEMIDWELDHYCEIDKYACKSYNMIHGTTDDDNLKDVTNIDYSKIGEIDLLTYGFPCQDISLAGQQKGFVDENGERTRSGLFFNAADIIEKTKPKFAIFENVKNLTSKKFKKEFEIVLSTLDELGYNTYWKVLNAKDYGIPQNRERVFGISIRKDIDKGYEFPQGFELKLRLKDMLEQEVDEKYYLSEKVTERLKITDPTMTKNIVGTTKPDFRTIGQRDAVYQTNGIMGSLVASDYKQPKQILEEPELKQIGGIGERKFGKQYRQGDRVYDANGVAACLTAQPLGNTGWYSSLYAVEEELSSKRLGGVFDDEKGKHQAGSVWDTNGLSPTLDTMQGGYRQPCVVVPENTKKGYKEAYEDDGVYINRPHQKRGVVQHGMIQTLKTGQDVGVVVKEPKIKVLGNYSKSNHNASRIVDREGIAPTVMENHGTVTAINEPLICASRGRNPENPSSRKAGEHTEQRIEVNYSGCSNTLTTVQKDNYVLEPQLRIRKLTPRECWRLMGFKDRYFDRVQGVSNTQLYKQAGNSIVVDVLRAIFRELKNQYQEYFEEIDLLDL